MAKSIYVIIYGRGGHQEQMTRLLDKGLLSDVPEGCVLEFTDSKHPIGIGKTYLFREFRDKYSFFKTILFLPFNALNLIFKTMTILLKYDVKGVVTTGPGVAILPCILFRLFGKKTVVFESWSKFLQPSYTARILYHFSGVFIIQNKSLYKFFPKAKYWGHL